jgi:hypothetical protein
MRTLHRRAKNYVSTRYAERALEINTRSVNVTRLKRFKRLPRIIVMGTRRSPKKRNQQVPLLRLLRPHSIFRAYFDKTVRKRVGAMWEARCSHLLPAYRTNGTTITQPEIDMAYT